MSMADPVRVFYVPAREEDGPDVLAAKAGRALAALDFLETLEAEDFCALKIHFGERNNKGYIKPEWLRSIVAAVRAKTPRAFLTDSNTLYIGPRSNSVEHIRLAWSHVSALSIRGSPPRIPERNSAYTAKAVGAST